MSELIVGPLLEDIIDADLSGPTATLCTAFYTRTPLRNFSVSGESLKLLVRLNTSDLREWIDGVVDPEALLGFIERHEENRVRVELRRSKSAHAKVYLGRTALLIGSANFTGNGLSGKQHEVFWRDDRLTARRRANERLEAYSARLVPMTTGELRAFVHANKERVFEKRKELPKRRAQEDRPQLIDGRPERLGSYNGFVAWLGTQEFLAAQTILDRAHGAAQLSGHVRNCFYGGRQLLVNDPFYRRRLTLQNPNTYRVFGDRTAELRIRSFSNSEVSDEPGFSAAVWRNISPIELGGRVGRRGGSIGSLNKILPLLARYLGETQGD